MIFLKPEFEHIQQKPGRQGMFEQIEIAGRSCYKSEPKYCYEYDGKIYDLDDTYNDSINKPDFYKFLVEEAAKPNSSVKKISKSAKDFTQKLINSKHTSVLEHGAVYLRFPWSMDWDSIISRFEKNPYSKVVIWNGYIYVSTNYRVIVENDLLKIFEDDRFYCPEPMQRHEQRITIKFSTDRGVSAEANRHRVNSPTEQSTRYCNFSKDKFGNEISIMQAPEFSDEHIANTVNNWDLEKLSKFIIDNKDKECFSEIHYWLFANLACEYSYMNLIRLGWKAQQARRVLPLDLHTELYHTAFVSDWKRFFILRADKSAHPDMQALAIPLQEYFKSIKLI